MFLKNNYIPKKFDESVLHVETISKLKILTKFNFMNIVLYGVNGVGKYVLSKLILDNLFGSDVNKLQCYNEKPNYFYSSYHYEIYLEKNHNKDDLKVFIESISNSKNIGSDFNNILIIKNAHFLDKEVLFYIKKLIECDYPIYFILLFNNMSFLPKSFKNIFLSIRVPKIDKSELSLFIKSVCENEKIKIGNSTIEEMIYQNKKNITKILINIQYYKKTNKLLKYSNSEIDKLLQLVYERKNTNILKIRETLYDLTSKGIQKKLLIDYSVEQMLKRIKDQETKMEFISDICKMDENFSVSYKELIHLDYFFILLMKYC